CIRAARRRPARGDRCAAGLPNRSRTGPAHRRRNVHPVAGRRPRRGTERTLTITHPQERIMNALSKGLGLATQTYRGLDWLAPLGDLLLRLYVANVFWKAGLVKIQSWSSTLY